VAGEATEGKRVSWVELYLDLIYALGVGQLAHVIVQDPSMDSVWIALGLFVTLWWTWIGFAVQYNREGEDDWRERLLFLAGSVPTGAAAVAIAPAADGRIAAFAIAMAAVRVVLLVGTTIGDDVREALRLRVAQAYALSIVLFGVSAALPAGPWRFALWGIALAVESGAVLTQHRPKRERRGRPTREERRAHGQLDIRQFAPDDPAEALDAHHFAERFGLFLIILLGELVISAGETSAEEHVGTAGGWAALVAGMVLAATLWWLYFNAAAEFNLRVLQLSGGSPAMARTLFAIGHMPAAFALLLIAAGVRLLLGDEPPDAAYTLVGVGCGIYLIGTRVFFGVSTRIEHAMRLVMVVATFALGELAAVLSPHTFLWVVAAWMITCAALAQWRTRVFDEELLTGGYA
jgi:low temperature requirement protein LtrA